MKPITLEISGWGPYKGTETIDFEKLSERGLFLITGPTGAGKTTIFDAISFALYGNLSGVMREKNTVRSDFAERDTKTYVRLKMMHKGECYDIYRNPEYMRPKKRKTGTDDYTKEKENAVLTMPDGTCVEGAAEVTKKIQEILVLDYRQFKQISMIAQGEFAKLLTENPTEKVKIFRELFGTAELERFAANLRARSKELYKEVVEYRHRMDEDVHLLHIEDVEWNLLAQRENKDYDAIFACLEVLEKRYKAEQKQGKEELEKMEREEKELSGKILECKNVSELASKLEVKQLQLDELEAKKAFFEQKKEEADSIRRARLVEPEYIRYQHAKKQWKDLEMSIKGVQEKEEMIQRSLSKTTPYFEQKDLLQSIIEVEKRKQDCEKELELGKQQWSEKQKQAERNQACYLKAEAFVKGAREQLEEAEQQYRRSAIGIVSRMLIPKQPCPICGSEEHPNPAPCHDGIIDEKQLKKLRKEYENENQAMQRVHEQAVLAYHEAEQMKEKCDLQEQMLQSLLEQCKNLNAQISEERWKIWCALSSKDKEKELIKTIRVHEENQLQLEKNNELKEHIRREMTRVSDEMTLVEENYKSAILVHNMESEGAFLHALGKKEKEEKLLREYTLYQEEKKTVTDLVNHLKKEKEDAISKQKEMEAEEVLQEAYHACVLRKKVLSEQWMQASGLLRDIKKIKEALRTKYKKQESLSREYGIVKDLDNLASGNNPKRLVFEQYVLSVWFEQVLEAANIRLKHMTSGRYEMYRKEEVADGRSKDNLEICVMDYYTGKTRSVKTLSGGETFKASLALALGLSDVIGRTNGGIRVDTLFVDEGFGALDSQSLDQACETLLTLVEKERLIGIISHVPELRERIDNQLIIKKTNSGSKIENVIV